MFLPCFVSRKRAAAFSTLVSICAYGRAARARSCARRNFAAETIFMALVICRVLVTLRMRRRMSRMLGMNQSSVVGHSLLAVGKAGVGPGLRQARRSPRPHACFALRRIRPG